MRWATRPGVHVDRAATAWLIRRWIDPEPEFLFVDDPADVPADATAFDMIGVELSHRGEWVTFETALADHGLDDPTLARIGRIIHEADLADERFDAPEAAGIDAIIRGMSMITDDVSLLATTDVLFDGLYASLSRRTTPEQR